MNLDIWRHFMERNWVTIEGNEAVATVAHALSEVIAIYPITPSTPMGEYADAWSAAGRVNLWGKKTLEVVIKCEDGVAASIHGELDAGALVINFTALVFMLIIIRNNYM